MSSPSPSFFVWCWVTVPFRVPSNVLTSCHRLFLRLPALSSRSRVAIQLLWWWESVRHLSLSDAQASSLPLALCLSERPLSCLGRRSFHVALHLLSGLYMKLTCPVRVHSIFLVFNRMSSSLVCVLSLSLHRALSPLCSFFCALIYTHGAKRIMCLSLAVDVTLNLGSEATRSRKYAPNDSRLIGQIGTGYTHKKVTY